MIRKVLMVGVPALVLVGGCSVGPSEDEVRSALRSELDAAGLSWVEMEVEDRAVRLGGFAPELGAGGLAVRTAEETMCHTALGLRPCAASVSADFGTSLADGEAWPRLEATVALGVLTLKGTVPDEASRLAANNAASEGIHGNRIERYVDGLVIQDVLPRPGSQALLKRLTRALTHCLDGSASIVGGEVTMACRLPSGGVGAVRRILASPLPAGKLVELDLVEAVDPKGQSTASR